MFPQFHVRAMKIEGGGGSELSPHRLSQQDLWEARGSPSRVSMKLQNISAPLYTLVKNPEPCYKISGRETPWMDSNNLLSLLNSECTRRKTEEVS